MPRASRRSTMLRYAGMHLASGMSARDIAAQEYVREGYVEQLLYEFSVASDSLPADAPTIEHFRPMSHALAFSFKEFEPRGAGGRSLRRANHEFLRALHLEALTQVRTNG